MTQSSSVRASLLVLLVSLALVGGASAGAAGTSTSDGVSSDSHSVAAPPHVAQQTTPIPTNNSTLRHRNPDEVASENRLDELQGLLGGRLADRLSESSVQLSEEQYDQARSVLGEAYLDQLGKYGDVAGERGDDNATSAAETFNETRDTQREYSETVGEFRETVDEYQEAKANGNDARARQLAREAIQLGREAARQAERLNESYGQLEQVTEADLTQAQANIETVQTNVDENRTELETTEFATTTLTIRTEETQGSFTDPFVLTGELMGADGPVADRVIRLSVGPKNGTVQTNESGAFALTYRPTVIPANASNLSVRYTPRETSIYSGSNTTVPVEIEQVTAQASLDRASTETAFGEPTTARGTLTVNGTAVSGFPLSLSVDGVRVASARTAANGSFVVGGSLPAAPRAGNQTLAVSAALRDRALVVDEVASPVQVRETPTTVSARVADAADTTISGRLTAEGQPVADQRLVVTIAGDRVGTTRTNAQGGYLVRVDGEDGTATVRFAGEGTNLGSAESSVRLPTETAAGSETETAASGEPAPPGFVALLFSDPLAALTTPIGLVASGIVLGVVGLGAVAVRRRYTVASAPTGTTGTAGTDAEPSSASPPGSPESADATTVDPLAAAVAALNDGTTDDAVIGAYAVIRQTFASAVADGRARTHWQFFDACVAAGVDAEPLRTITEAYEKARYGSDASSTTAAEAALEAARSLVSDDGSDAAESVSPGDD